jgi:hypothetical protein
LVTLKTKLALLQLNNSPKGLLRKRVALAFLKVSGDVGAADDGKPHPLRANRSEDAADHMPPKQRPKTP